MVIYDAELPEDHAARQSVRRAAAGKLLKADRALRRDVIRVPNGDAAAIALLLKKLARVHDVYPDLVAHAAFTPNDPLLADEWGLAKIQAETAWDTSQGAGVTVAVLDCGIHTAHPDLQGQVTLERNFTSTSSTDDRCNHGTHVAGTIAALTNNDAGVAAVAPGARLLNGKVLDDNGDGFFSAIDDGIKWAADNGAKVINLSLGADTDCPSGTQVAVDYAWSRGAIVVAAAGNAQSGAAPLSHAGAPANCINAVGVAATDSGDVIGSFSYYGTNVDVAAPGVGILSTLNPELAGNDGVLYGTFNGTSMATPHTAGVLALLWASTHGGGASPQAVVDRLFGTADRIAGTGGSWTHGRINAAAAVGSGAAQPTFTPTPAPLAGSNSFAGAPTLALPGTAAGNTSQATVESGEPRPCGSIGKTVWLRMAPSVSGTLTARSAGSAYDTVLALYRGTSLSGLTSLACNDDDGGTLQSAVTGSLTAGQTYYLQVGGYNGAGGAFTLDVAFQATASATASSSPTRTATPAATVTATPTSTATLAATATATALATATWSGCSPTSEPRPSTCWARRPTSCNCAPKSSSTARSRKSKRVSSNSNATAARHDTFPRTAHPSAWRGSLPANTCGRCRHGRASPRTTSTDPTIPTAHDSSCC